MSLDQQQTFNWLVNENNRLRERVKKLGEMADVCTFSDLEEVCVGCRCGKAPAAGTEEN